MTEVILAMMVWIGQNTDYTIPENGPNVVVTESHNLCAQYGIDDPSRCKNLKLMGFYNESQTVYLHGHFDINNIPDRSRLLHELVHFVQWHNDLGGDCRGELEAEAYTLQGNWRTEQGLAAGTDDFKVMMLQASCEA